MDFAGRFESGEAIIGPIWKGNESKLNSSEADPVRDDICQFIIRKHSFQADLNPLRNFWLSDIRTFTARSASPTDTVGREVYLNSKCVKIIRLIDCDQESVVGARSGWR